MKDTDSLYSRRPGLGQRLEELQRLQNLNDLADKVVDLIVEADTQVTTPGIEHVKTALRRVVGDIIPTGKAFASKFYDIHSEVVSNYSDAQGLESSTSKQPMRSRLFVISKDNDGGILGKKIDEWLDGETEVKSSVIIHTLTPNGDISFDIHTITFVVVRIRGGGAFCYEIVPNDNMGKIIPTEAMQDEFGNVRESFGYIDKCPVKAVELSPIHRILVQDELKRMLEILPRPTSPQEEAPLREIRRRLEAIRLDIGGRIGKFAGSTLLSTDKDVARE